MNNLKDQNLKNMKEYFPKIIEEILQERERQIDLWNNDGCHSFDRLYTILGEEVGEIARAILEKDNANLHDELVQVCAVCIKFLQQVDSHESNS